MTADEVAELLSCHRESVLRYARDPNRRHLLGAFQFGHKWLFKRSAVEKFIEGGGK